MSLQNSQLPNGFHLAQRKSSRLCNSLKTPCDLARVLALISSPTISSFLLLSSQLASKQFLSRKVCSHLSSFAPDFAWNTSSRCTACSLTSFKRFLKCHLPSEAFCDYLKL